jgi:hypothetical protein
MIEKIMITMGMLSPFVRMSLKSWFCAPTTKKPATSAAIVAMTAGRVMKRIFQMSSTKTSVASEMKMAGAARELKRS